MPGSESPSNAILLEQNEEEVGSKVRGYLETVAPPSVEEVKESSAKLTSDSSADFSGITALSYGRYEGEVQRFYSKAIYALQEARDAKQGVKWHLTAPNKDGTRTIIRDTRSLGEKDAPDPNSPHSYVMNYLNLSRAAEVLLDQAADKGADISEVRKTFRKRAADLVISLSGGEPISSATLSRLTHSLVSDLKNLKGSDSKPVFQDVKKTLDRAKSLTQLDDEHFHTTTLSTAKDAKGRDRVVVESEIMCLGTTDDLRKQYDHIVRGETKEIEWYNKLKPEQQVLVKRYAKELGEGKKVLSSQMFDFVPGMKNAYLKVTSVSEPDRPTVLKPVAKILHCGTPSFHGKTSLGNIVEMSALNIEQARSFADRGEGRSLDFALHTLNSGGQDIKSKEAEIVAALEDASESLGKSSVTLDKVPVNFFRRMSQSTHGFSEGGLKEFASLLKSCALETERVTPETYKDIILIAKYAEKGETMPWYKQVFWQSDKLQAQRGLKRVASLKPELATLANAGFRLRESMERGMFDTRNSNFHISTAASLVDHALNARRGDIHADRKKFYFCKSGKDRTGSVTMKTSHIAVCDALGLTAEGLKGGAEAREAETKANSNLVRLAMAGNSQYMAGIAGGTIGSHGIIPHTPGQLFDSHEVTAIARHMGHKLQSIIKFPLKELLTALLKRYSRMH